MACSTSVQTLIDQYERMVQVTATPKAPSTWSVTTKVVPVGSPQPKSMSPVREIISLFDHMQEKDRPAEEAALMKKSIVHAMPAQTKSAAFKSLTVLTMQFQDESDTDAKTTLKSMCYSHMPRSPSVYSTTSTASMDSLSSSMEMLAPTFGQLSGDANTDSLYNFKPRIDRLTGSPLVKSLPQTSFSKLVPRPSCRRNLPKRKPLSPKTTHSSRVAPPPTKPRRSSLSASIALSSGKSTSQTSMSTRSIPAQVTSHCAGSRRKSLPTARYMNYDSSPRFVATKAINLERRQKLEERNQNLAVDQIRHRGRRTAR